MKLRQNSEVPDRRRKVLILSGTPTHPTNAGNRASLRSWVEAYLAMGVEVHFAFIRQEAADEAGMALAWHRDRCHFLDYQLPRRRFTIPQRLRLRVARHLGRSLCLPYKTDDWCGDSLVEKVRELARQIQPDCVQIEYVFFSRLFECFDSSVYKILNTHGKMADRDRVSLKKGRQPQWFFTTPGQESIGVNRADLIVSIQEPETLYFKTITRKPVVTVGTKIHLNSSPAPSTSAPTMIFIGSLNGVNQDAIEFLAGEIWPRVRAAVPGAVLEIYGRICGHPIARTEGLHLMGEVAAISTAYDRAWLVTCPLQFGYGLKRKCIEAIGQGKALVSTSAGSEGLENGLGTAFLRADSAGHFAGLCINVLTDPGLRLRLEQGARAFAADWNSQQDAIQRNVMELAGLI